MALSSQALPYHKKLHWACWNVMSLLQSWHHQLNDILNLKKINTNLTSFKINKDEGSNSNKIIVFPRKKINNLNNKNFKMQKIKIGKWMLTFSIMFLLLLTAEYKCVRWEWDSQLLCDFSVFPTCFYIVKPTKA